mmetsp:Transcript_33535/g.91834  ORF Transcript_33535/g.91834 Transcript_33535/m.91834 type:complete len:236 (-) Transcript_33535:721-1428(-)
MSKHMARRRRRHASWRSRSPSAACERACERSVAVEIHGVGSDAARVGRQEGQLLGLTRFAGVTHSSADSPRSSASYRASARRSDDCSSGEETTSLGRLYCSVDVATSSTAITSWGVTGASKSCTEMVIVSIIAIACAYTRAMLSAYFRTAEMARPLSALHTTTVHAAGVKPQSTPLLRMTSPSFRYAPAPLKITPHTYICTFCQWIDAEGRALSSCGRRGTAGQVPNGPARSCPP